MLDRIGHSGPRGEDARLADIFTRHLAEVDRMLDAHPGIVRLDVDYPSVIATPSRVVETVRAFLGGTLDAERMVAAVAPELHRQR
jgi:hypothetical protein